MTTEKTPSTMEHFLTECEDVFKDLTQWEQGFITSLRDQYDRRHTMSDKQFEVLERIYADRTA